MQLVSCPRCDGFVPQSASKCPHCAAAKSSVWGTMSRAALAVVSGSALSVTLMACYGSPPCETGPDGDGDGIGPEASGVCGPSEFDCNGEDATIHPGADDAEGDGIDQNCDGVDGTRCLGSGTDADGDGFVSPENDTCIRNDSVDCDDADPASKPYADDAEGDGIDQNCDGADGLAPAEGEGEGG